MKSLVTLLISCFLFFGAPVAQAEGVNTSNQAIYFMHFGRGSEKLPVSLMQFYTFVTEAFSGFATSGLTSITSHAYRIKDRALKNKNTTIIEIVGSPELIEEEVYAAAQKYCDTFSAQEAMVLVVQVPYVSTSIFE